MAVPRVFISSTCYDLQEIRFQLRKFIEDLGYEPVMSEFGDIFYEPTQHVQDACKSEIEKSNIFVLIIGNNYGSIYHRQSLNDKIPESITLQEFKKSLETGITKYIFINKYVQYDFENYRRLFNKSLEKYFSENEIEDGQVETTKKQLKSKYDESYPFPQEAYRYIFHFLDALYNLDINNALYSFESFDDIKDNLKKQWAGFVYDSLTKDKNVAIVHIENIAKRLDKIEHQLKLFNEGTKSVSDHNTITIDIGKLNSEYNIENLLEIQDKINSLLYRLLHTSRGDRRIIFKEKYDTAKCSEWLDALPKIILKYKWSKYVSINEIFSQVPFSYWTNRAEIPHRDLLEFNSIVQKLTDEDKQLLLNTISIKFNNLYEQPIDDENPFKDDDVPF